MLRRVMQRAKSTNIPAGLGHTILRLSLVSAWLAFLSPRCSAAVPDTSSHGISVLSETGRLVEFFRLPLIPNDLDIIPETNQIVVATRGPILILNPDGRIVAALPWSQMSDVDVLQPDGGRLLLCSMEGKRVFIATKSGGEEDATEVSLEGPADADLLPNGHLLIADAQGNRVVEVDPESRIVWEYSQGLLHPWDAERLADGSTAIADFDGHQVLIVDLAGRLVRRYGNFDHPRRITVAPNGRLLVADCDSDRIVALREDGSQSVFCEKLNRVAAIAPLPGGRYAVASESRLVSPSLSPGSHRDRRPPLVRFSLLFLAVVAVLAGRLWRRGGTGSERDRSWRSLAAAASGLAALACQYRWAAGESLDYPWTYPAALIVLCLAVAPAVRRLQGAAPFTERLRERLSAPPEPLGRAVWLWGLAIFAGGAGCFFLRYTSVPYSKILLLWFPGLLLSLWPVWRALRHAAWQTPGKGFGFHLFRPARADEPTKDQGVADVKCHIVFLLIFLLAIPVLSFRLEEYPTSVHGDSAEVALEGIRLWNMQPLHFFRLGWYHIPALFFLYPAAVMHGFGETVWGMRLSDVFMGLFALPFFYGLLRRLYGSRVAVIGTALLAGCAYFIHFSRLGIGYNQTLFATVVVFYLFLRAVETGSVVWYALCGLSLGVSFYSYQASRVLMVLVGLSWLVLGLRMRGLFRRDWARLVLLGGVMWFVLSPLLAQYTLYPQSLNSRTREVSVFGEVGRRFIQKRYGLSTSWRDLAWEQLKQGVGAPVAFADGSPYLNNEGYEGILEPGTAVLFLTGAILFAVTIGSPGSFLPILWLFPLLLFGGAMTNNAPSYQRYVGMVPAMVMFAAPVLLALGECVVPWSRGEGARKVLIAVLVGFICFSGVHRYFHGMMQLKQPVDEWTRIARYVAGRGPENYTYLFGKPYVVFGYGTIRFMARGCLGEDVSDPEGLLSRRVSRRGPVSFVFVFENERYLTGVRDLYPGGVEIRHRNADGITSFLSYHTAPGGLNRGPNPRSQRNRGRK